MIIIFNLSKIKETYKIQNHNNNNNKINNNNNKKKISKNLAYN